LTAFAAPLWQKATETVNPVKKDVEVAYDLLMWWRTVIEQADHNRVLPLKRC